MGLWDPTEVAAEVHALDAVDAVEGWLRKLPARNARVCRLIYLHGRPQELVADDLGCSQAEVSRLHRQALELLSSPTRFRPGNDPARFRRSTDPKNPEPREDGRCLS